MLNDAEQDMLLDWEDIFKQGLLTFWVLSALKDAQLTVQEVSNEVAQLTKDTYTPAEQTLYRLLRKQYDLKLVDFKELANPNGPKKKLYELTDTGERMLTEFAQRNIELFQSSKIKDILKGDKN